MKTIQACGRRNDQLSLVQKLQFYDLEPDTTVNRHPYSFGIFCGTAATKNRPLLCTDCAKLLGFAW